TYLLRMRALAGSVAVVFLLLAVIHALVRADPAILGRALRQLAFAALLTAGLIWGTRTGMQGADQMAAYVIGGALQRGAARVIADLGAGYTTAVDSGAAPLFFVAVSAVLTVIVAFLLWIEFAVRTAVIDLAVLFFPLLLAASIWAPAAGAVRRMVEVLVT